jgi:hypothetical protein
MQVPCHRHSKEDVLLMENRFAQFSSRSPSRPVPPLGAGAAGLLNYPIIIFRESHAPVPRARRREEAACRNRRPPEAGKGGADEERNAQPRPTSATSRKDGYVEWQRGWILDGARIP